jgi:hypothetical protein
MDREALCNRIDLIADTQRTKLVGDLSKSFEYTETALQAQAYHDAGYTGDVPEAVDAWADAKGWTHQAACDDIMREAEIYRQALFGIRRVRLVGKESVRNASSDEDAEAVFNQVIIDLKQIAYPE